LSAVSGWLARVHRAARYEISPRLRVEVVLVDGPVLVEGEEVVLRRTDLDELRERLAGGREPRIIVTVFTDVHRCPLCPIVGRDQLSRDPLRSSSPGAAREAHRSSDGRVGGDSWAEPPPGAHLPAPVETATLTVSSRNGAGINANGPR